MTSLHKHLAQRFGEFQFAGELAQALAVLRRGWKLIALGLASCLTLAVVYLAAAERLYQSTTRLLVLQHGGRPLSVASGDGGGLLEGTDDFLPTHAVVIRSPMVVSQAIEDVGIENLPTLARLKRQGRNPVQEAIDRLSVTRPDRTAKILRVDYLAGDRAEAVRTIEAVTAAYRDFLEDNYRNKNNQVVDLITKARDEIKGELDVAEQAYMDFHQKNLIHSTDESGRSFLTRRLDHWDRAANEAMVREIQLQSQLELGRNLAGSGTGLWAVAFALSQISGDASNGPLSHAAAVSHGTASDYVRQLTQEQQALAEKFGPQYSKVKELEEQISRAQERMRDSRGRLDAVETADLLASIEQSLKAIAAMRESITRRFDEDLAAAKVAEADLMTEAKLRDGLERQRSLFNTVVDQLKQARFTSDFASISAQTIEPANALPSPVRPRTAMTLALALLAGTALGAAGVLVGERIDARVRSTEEVRKVLGFPMLGQVPQLPRAAGGPTHQAGLIGHTMPRSPMSESFKIIRTRLDMARRTRDLQVLLVSSPHQGDGKSVSASNLAISVAQTGRRVLLVDADLRRPSQDFIHNLPAKQGLSHILRDLLPARRVVNRSLVENLDIIPAGPGAQGPAELLSSGRLAAFLEDARRDYDLVIVDSPPLLAVADSAIIANHVDGIVLVVRTESLRQRDAERVVDLLESVGTHVVGTIVNRIGAEKSAYLYGYGPSEEPAAEAVAASAAADPLANGTATAHAARDAGGTDDDFA